MPLFPRGNNFSSIPIASVAGSCLNVYIHFKIVASQIATLQYSSSQYIISTWIHSLFYHHYCKVTAEHIIWAAYIRRWTDSLDEGFINVDGKSSWLRHLVSCNIGVELFMGDIEPNLRWMLWLFPCLSSALFRMMAVH